MPKYYIEIPYTGKLMVEITAESEEAALDIIYENDRDKLEELDCVEYADIEEEYHEKVVEGNVFHGVLSRLDITKLED